MSTAYICDVERNFSIYGSVFMQYITMFYVLFHTGLRIINSTSLLQQWVSESQNRWGGAG